MNVIASKVVIVLTAVWVCVFSAIPAEAEEIEETIKYKAPTMQQTIGYVDKLTAGNFEFNRSQCEVVTQKYINSAKFEYHIPLKKINPSPDYVKTHLECTILTVDGYENEIKRIEDNGDVEMKNRIDICTPDRESAENLTWAIRYLISLCGGPSCHDCDPYMWE